MNPKATLTLAALTDKERMEIKANTWAVQTERCTHAAKHRYCTTLRVPTNRGKLEIKIDANTRGFTSPYFIALRIRHLRAGLSRGSYRNPVVVESFDIQSLVDYIIPSERLVLAWSAAMDIDTCEGYVDNLHQTSTHPTLKNHRIRKYYSRTLVSSGPH